MIEIFCIYFDLFALKIQHQIVSCSCAHTFFFIKIWIKHALKSYKIKWCNHRIKKIIFTLLVSYYFFYLFALIIKENSEWQKSKILLKYYWIINFCCYYTCVIEMYWTCTCIFYNKISSLMFRFWEILMNIQLFRSI